MRHCERSEAIHVCCRAKWIASSQGLLAMTGKQLYFMGYTSSRALRMRGQNRFMTQQVYTPG
jgi:hypothetical protein